MAVLVEAVPIHCQTEILGVMVNHRFSVCPLNFIDTLKLYLRPSLYSYIVDVLQPCGVIVVPVRRIITTTSSP